MVNALLSERRLALGEPPAAVESPRTGSVFLVLPVAALAVGALSLHRFELAALLQDAFNL